MAEPFLAEVRIFSFVFAPKGWALCNGQLLPINQNQALFSLLGTTYGGDGRVNFALPDLRGRIPVYIGGSSSFTLGERGGEAAHTLTISELPQHNHMINATSAGGTVAAANASAMIASVSSSLYNTPTALTTLNPSSITNVGGSQAHNNMMPYLTLSFCIALQGIFPSQT
ncbi:MAG: phage tail protein [Lysobacterales bacterium 69-70]|nr:phage tail protein [Xanthomonadaceae bacterium]ODU30760.1 MAG: phage tail protein [Xanthomonadaceae bacterium SCN 69-320]ODV17690.1 MAG: phage tail protein [Xanthomonadaceae bacterium SCN 69-25]OJZ00299.1 MAG: phage tail protein [Xanthomonadales bacterium 69-70]